MLIVTYYKYSRKSLCKSHVDNSPSWKNNTSVLRIQYNIELPDCGISAKNFEDAHIQLQKILGSGEPENPGSRPSESCCPETKNDINCQSNGKVPTDKGICGQEDEPSEIIHHVARENFQVPNIVIDPELGNTQITRTSEAILEQELNEARSSLGQSVATLPQTDIENIMVGRTQLKRGRKAKKTKGRSSETVSQWLTHATKPSVKLLNNAAKTNSKFSKSIVDTVQPTSEQLPEVKATEEPKLNVESDIETRVRTRRASARLTPKELKNHQSSSPEKRQIKISIPLDKIEACKYITQSQTPVIAVSDDSARYTTPNKAVGPDLKMDNIATGKRIPSRKRKYTCDVPLPVATNTVSEPCSPSIAPAILNEMRGKVVTISLTRLQDETIQFLTNNNCDLGIVNTNTKDCCDIPQKRKCKETSSGSTGVDCQSAGLPLLETASASFVETSMLSDINPNESQVQPTASEQNVRCRLNSSTNVVISNSKVSKSVNFMEIDQDRTNNSIDMTSTGKSVQNSQEAESLLPSLSGLPEMVVCQSLPPNAVNIVAEKDKARSSEVTSNIYLPDETKFSTPKRPTYDQTITSGFNTQSGFISQITSKENLPKSSHHEVESRKSMPAPPCTTEAQHTSPSKGDDDSFVQLDDDCLSLIAESYTSFVKPPSRENNPFNLKPNPVKKTRCEKSVDASCQKSSVVQPQANTVVAGTCDVPSPNPSTTMSREKHSDSCMLFIDERNDGKDWLKSFTPKICYEYFGENSCHNRCHKLHSFTGLAEEPASRIHILLNFLRLNQLHRARYSVVEAVANHCFANENHFIKALKDLLLMEVRMDVFACRVNNPDSILNLIFECMCNSPTISESWLEFAEEAPQNYKYKHTVISNLINGCLLLPRASMSQEKMAWNIFHKVLLQVDTNDVNKMEFIIKPLQSFKLMLSYSYLDLHKHFDNHFQSSLQLQYTTRKYSSGQKMTNNMNRGPVMIHGVRPAVQLPPLGAPFNHHNDPRFGPRGPWPSRLVNRFESTRFPNPHLNFYNGYRPNIHGNLHPRQTYGDHVNGPATPLESRTPPFRNDFIGSVSSVRPTYTNDFNHHQHPFGSINRGMQDHPVQTDFQGRRSSFELQQPPCRQDSIGAGVGVQRPSYHEDANDHTHSRMALQQAPSTRVDLQQPVPLMDKIIENPFLRVDQQSLPCPSDVNRCGTEGIDQQTSTPEYQRSNLRQTSSGLGNVFNRFAVPNVSDTLVKNSALTSKNNMPQINSVADILNKQAIAVVRPRKYRMASDFNCHIPTAESVVSSDSGPSRSPSLPEDGFSDEDELVSEVDSGHGIKVHEFNTMYNVSDESVPNNLFPSRQKSYERVTAVTTKQAISKEQDFKNDTSRVSNFLSAGLLGEVITFMYKWKDQPYNSKICKIIFEYISSANDPAKLFGKLAHYAEKGNSGQTLYGPNIQLMLASIAVNVILELRRIHLFKRNFLEILAVLDRRRIAFETDVVFDEISAYTIGYQKLVYADLYLRADQMDIAWKVIKEHGLCQISMAWNVTGSSEDEIFRDDICERLLIALIKTNDINRAHELYMAIHVPPISVNLTSLISRHCSELLLVLINCNNVTEALEIFTLPSTNINNLEPLVVRGLVVSLKAKGFLKEAIRTYGIASSIYPKVKISRNIINLSVLSTWVAEEVELIVGNFFKQVLQGYMLSYGNLDRFIPLVTINVTLQDRRNLPNVRTIPNCLNKQDNSMAGTLLQIRRILLKFTNKMEINQLKFQEDVKDRLIIKNDSIQYFLDKLATLQDVDILLE